MPRFVAKEDVQKGLVDPNKPLGQQPEYKKKLDQQTKKKEPKENKKPRRQRQDRPQYNWNKRQITQETPVPQAPKKLLPKPDNEKFRAQMQKMKEQKDSLFEQRKKLIEEQKILIKSNSENKKSGVHALSKYSGQLKEKNNLKNIIDGKIKKLEAQKDEVDNQIKALKQTNTTLRSPNNLELYSKQRLNERIAQLEQRLSSAKLSKQQQNTITNDINQAKRALLKAKSDLDIKTQTSKNDDKIKILIEESRSLKKQIDAQYNQLKPLKKQIYQLLQKRKEEQGTITEVRSIEQIRAQYDKKIQAVDAKREEMNKKMDQLRDKHNKQFDAYDDQQDLLRYIQYVKEEKQYKRKKKQEEQKRRKQRQQREKQKQKQFEERQRRRQQRKKQQEERQKRQQQKRQKLQKEREQYVSRNPNWQKIDLCNFMISYCQNLKPQNIQRQTQQQKNVKPQDINLANKKEWQKQAKRGCQVIVGKKQKVDQQAPKKVKKQKKKKQAEEDGSINHTIDSANRFHELNVLPPSNVSELDQTIQQLRDKIDIYSKPSEEQVAAFRSKAEAQFDRMHGLTAARHEYQEKEEEQQPSRHGKKKERNEKVELQTADFPGLE